MPPRAPAPKSRFQNKHAKQMPQSAFNLSFVWYTTARLVFALLWCSSALGAADSNSVVSTAPAPLRFAFSVGVLGEVNPNDAKASIIAWGKALMGSRTIAADIQPSIFDRIEDLFGALQNGQLDGAAMMMDEFQARPAALEPEAVYLSMKNGKATEQYVLLVHRSSGISNLAGLKGRNIEIQKSNRTSLVTPWLETSLSSQGLGLPNGFFGKIECVQKVSRVILRVFFHQTDACIATQAAFETMCELNPQLRQDLSVVGISPEVVPGVFFLRPGFAGGLRQELEAAMLSLHETVAGRQVLIVFQGDRMGKHPLTSLESAVDLLEASARLRSTTTDTNSEKFLSAPPQ
jgi:phosphonate transport system substrate-binding protein